MKSKIDLTSGEAIESSTVAERYRASIHRYTPSLERPLPRTSSSRCIQGQRAAVLFRRVAGLLQIGTGAMADEAARFDLEIEEIPLRCAVRERHAAEQIRDVRRRWLSPAGRLWSVSAYIGATPLG